MDICGYLCETSTDPRELNVAMDLVSEWNKDHGGFTLPKYFELKHKDNPRQSGLNYSNNAEQIIIIPTGLESFYFYTDF